MDETECFFCKYDTAICCADVHDTPINAATVPAKFISMSDTVATPTPTRTIRIACMVFLPNCLPRKIASRRHIVGICASLQTW